jgi:hypothetical protein
MRALKMAKDTYDIDVYEQYENKVDRSADDVLDLTDFKIRPDFYIHTAILKAQNAFNNPDLNSGFIQYILIIDHIETLIIAANKKPDLYEEKLSEFTKTAEYTEEENNIIKKVKLANYKSRLLLNEAFGSRTATASLKI